MHTSDITFSSHQKKRYYFLLMDSLIKTTKDVDLLCGKGILVNYLDDNGAAKSATNNLNKGILLISMRDDYVGLSNKLNSFYFL